MQRDQKQKNQNPRVLGALYGTQEGRRVEIRTSFELIYDIEDPATGSVTLDTYFVEEKKKQYEQVFPKYEVLGWYSTGDDLRPGDELIHEQMCQFNDSPLYLIVSTQFGTDVRDLPLHVLDSTIQAAAAAAVAPPTQQQQQSNTATMANTMTMRSQITWSRVNYQIETDESERISIDHVNRAADASSSAQQQSALVPHLSSLYNAVKMLNDRVRVVIQYLHTVKQQQQQQQQGGTGEVSLRDSDYRTLRHISSLCNRLPAVDSPKFSQEYVNELNESLMIAYLATMTKNSNLLNEVIDKYNVAYDKRARRGGGIF